MKKEKRKRTVPFLPNFITTMSLFCGFYSISFSLKGNYYMAAVLILIAGFIDGIDGRVARMTNSVSEFGKEYDSLSDVIAFGVSPAIMAYLWQLNQYGRFGFIACFLFVACGALRLARFNTDTSHNLTTFTGLPIPIAAAAVTSVVLLSKVVGSIPSLALLGGMYVLSFMMVSTIRFPSFKHISYIKAHPFQLLVAGVLLLMVVALAPEIMIFVLAMTFIVGGTLWNAIQSVRAYFSEKKHVEGTDHEGITRQDNNL
ncbi:MAG TPA: CDP-diacylglycerol--serine O-phosphatidyltransferase [Deltaproteobacteria bacterium]|nr:CDP-diacylglycerol--serine O-phosphatidyltransferase [Deltaproteobacteria bacterium]HPR51709.1 CDP-diacylglycerol--serine O-phosphatidyltransferase [Deltaproteobacteria bacterium]